MPGKPSIGRNPLVAGAVEDSNNLELKSLVCGVRTWAAREVV